MLRDVVIGLPMEELPEPAAQPPVAQPATGPAAQPQDTEPTVAQLKRKIEIRRKRMRTIWHGWVGVSIALIWIKIAFFIPYLKQMILLLNVTLSNTTATQATVPTEETEELFAWFDFFPFLTAIVVVTGVLFWGGMCVRDWCLPEY